MPGPRSLRSALNVGDMRRLAASTLPRVIFDFVEGGAEDEWTMRANRGAFSRRALVPRMGRLSDPPRTETSVLGHDLAFPLMLAPIGGLRMVHPEGQIAVSEAAQAKGLLSMVGSLNGSLLEDVAERVPGQWFQLYGIGGREGTRRLIERAAFAGYEVLVVTVDTPVSGRRERDVRNGGMQPGGMPLSRITLPSVLRFGPKVVRKPRWTTRFVRAGLPFEHPNLRRLTEADGPMDVDTAMTRWFAEPFVWSDLVWIRELWSGPIVVKGLVSADDAQKAVERGADGLVISNHGGRQLDGALASLDALADVVDAVGPDITVLVDGGIRRGSDIVRALAVGAHAVLIGRPYLYGLAVAGRLGVEHVIDLLAQEFGRTMALIGCSDVGRLDHSYLREVDRSIQRITGG